MPTQLKTIRLDGVEYEAEPPVIAALSRAREDNQRLIDQAKEDAIQTKAAKESISRLEGERDTAMERADKAEKELKAAQDAAISQEKLDAAVSQKIVLLGACKKAGVEVKVDSKDSDLQKAVVLKVFPSAQLDGRDEFYIQARFDGAVETLAAMDAEDAEMSATLGAANSPSFQSDGDGSGTATPKLDSGKARAKMIAEMTNHDSYRPAAGGGN